MRFAPAAGVISRPTILCPVDFSDASRTALHYAAIIADHFGARLVVLAVTDPLLSSVSESAGVPNLEAETDRELRRFLDDTAPAASRPATSFSVRVSVGKPAPEILRVARETGAELIVISSHGRSGISKRFFGATTERVLRETTIPVLITPRGVERLPSVTAIAQQVRRVLAPVDLTDASTHQLRVADGIAIGLGVPLLVAHVLESLHVPAQVRLAVAGIDSERRAAAESSLLDLVTATGVRGQVERHVLFGDPTEEIIRLTDARGVGLIIMGLHSSGLLGPRMGSVTYRVLCLTRALVLAIPPLTPPPGGHGDAAARDLVPSARD